MSTTEIIPNVNSFNPETESFSIPGFPIGSKQFFTLDTI